MKRCFSSETASHWYHILPADSILFTRAENRVPAFGISENEKWYVVNAKLSGVDVKDLEITIFGGVFLFRHLSLSEIRNFLLPRGLNFIIGIT